MSTVAAEEARLTAQGEGTFAVTGALTFGTVPDVYDQSSTALLTSAGPIVIDLEGLSRADSAGVALLVEWLRVAHKKGVSLKYVNVPEQIRSLARVNGLSDALGWNQR